MTSKLLMVLLVPMLATVFVVSDFGSSLTGSSVAVAQKKKRQGVSSACSVRATSRLNRHLREPSPAGVVAARIVTNQAQRPQASGIRTLCVRTCDGYCFPISNSTSRKRFKIDEAVCKAMYGGAEAPLRPQQRLAC